MILFTLPPSYLPPVGQIRAQRNRGQLKCCNSQELLAQSRQRGYYNSVAVWSLRRASSIVGLTLTCATAATEAASSRGGRESITDTDVKAPEIARFGQRE